MVSGRPIFPGATNEEQTVLIWQVLGTPTEAVWPGVSLLAEYRPEEWPVCERQDLKVLMPRLNRIGLDLCAGMLQYDPKRRFGATEAMAHCYFDDLAIPRTLGPTKSLFSLSHISAAPETMEGKHCSGASDEAIRRRASVA